MYKRVTVTGSMAFDHIMSMPGKFSDHIIPDKLHILNISFIMKTFRKEFGGTGGNIAYSLSLLGVPTVIAAPAGNDFADYTRHLTETKNLNNQTKIFKNVSTATGFVITDRDDNQIWGFYEGATKYADKINLANILKKDDFLVIAPNDPKAVIKYTTVALKRNIDYLFDPAFNIVHFPLKDLKTAITKCKILIGNDYEIELISKQLKTPKNKLVRPGQILVTTLGAKGAEIFTDNKTISIPPAKPLNVTDPTGAGDAFRAGFLAGYVREYPLEICGRMGALAAVYTVEKYGTQTHSFTPRSFNLRYGQNYK